MSNYTLSTDFTAKDSLISGNPAKLVKGSEISTEFNAVATAIASKVDKTSATGSAQIPAGTQAQRDGSPAAGYVRFNSSSGAFEGFDGTQWGPLGSNNGPVADVLTYTATAAQTVFTLTTAYTPGQRQIEVFVNGLLMSLTTDYVETDYQTITFNSGLTVGDEVVFRVWRVDTLVDGDAANMSYLPAGTSAIATTVQAKLRESVSVKDFGVTGSGDESSKIQAALDSGASIVDGVGLTCTINSAITIAANQTLRNIKLVAGTAGMNMVLVNTGSKLLTSKLTGTGTTSIVERGVYPAADGVSDVEIDAEITNLTVGVHAQPTSSVTPARWRIGGYIHDIVGTSGASEGYGVLLSPANGCSITTKFKTVKRHCVYLSSGASFNDTDIYVDGCGNFAVQIYSTAAQPECKLNRIRGEFTNLSQNAINQGGAVGIIQKANQNDVSVSVDGAAGTTTSAILVEGSGLGSGPYPSGNNIHDCEITGTYLGTVIRVLNAESTAVRNNRINANWATAAIFLIISGTASVSSGGFVEGNYILGAGSTNVGIANSYEVPFHVGTNDIKNIAGARFTDYSTAKKRTGRLKSVSGTVTTASISAGSFGDTVVTLPEDITASGRFVAVTNNGGSAGTYTYANGVTVFNTSDTTFTIRQHNGGASSQTFDLLWNVQGD